MLTLSILSKNIWSRPTPNDSTGLMQTHSPRRGIEQEYLRTVLQSRQHVSMRHQVRLPRLPDEMQMHMIRSHKMVTAACPQGKYELFLPFELQADNRLCAESFCCLQSQSVTYAQLSPQLSAHS